MWEITLVGKPKDLEYFLELKDYLKNLIKNDIIIVLSFENSLICSIALSNESKLSIVKRKIIEMIIKIVKTDFYLEKLKFFTADKSLNSFVLSSLIYVNLQDEVDFASKVADIAKYIDIRSFVYFRLHRLIDVWENEVEYYNYNFGNNQEELYLEILKFLASNSNAKQDIMYIEESSHDMILLDKQKKELKSIPKIDEIGILVQLIMLAPKKIIINCIGSLSQKVTNLISYIFEDRVSILL